MRYGRKKTEAKKHPARFLKPKTFFILLTVLSTANGIFCLNFQ